MSYKKRKTRILISQNSHVKTYIVLFHLNNKMLSLNGDSCGHEGGDIA